jgi:hypothetical protein
MPSSNGVPYPPLGLELDTLKVAIQGELSKMNIGRLSGVVLIAEVTRTVGDEEDPFLILWWDGAHVDDILKRAAEERREVL